jgi:hypothetical protein
VIRFAKRLATTVPHDQCSRPKACAMLWEMSIAAKRRRIRVSGACLAVAVECDDDVANRWQVSWLSLPEDDEQVLTERRRQR